MGDKPTIVHLAVISVAIVALTYGFLKLRSDAYPKPTKSYRMGHGPGIIKCTCTEDEPVMRYLFLLSNCPIHLHKVDTLSLSELYVIMIGIHTFHTCFKLFEESL